MRKTTFTEVTHIKTIDFVTCSLQQGFLSTIVSFGPCVIFMVFSIMVFSILSRVSLIIKNFISQNFQKKGIRSFLYEKYGKIIDEMGAQNQVTLICIRFTRIGSTYLYTHFSLERILKCPAIIAEFLVCNSFNLKPTYSSKYLPCVSWNTAVVLRT